MAIPITGLIEGIDAVQGIRVAVAAKQQRPAEILVRRPWCRNSGRVEQPIAIQVVGQVPFPPQPVGQQVVSSIAVRRDPVAKVSPKLTVQQSAEALGFFGRDRNSTERVAATELAAVLLMAPRTEEVFGFGKDV